MVVSENLTFGEALQALKSGRSVCRSGWNGKGMYLYLRYGSRDFSLVSEAKIEGVSASLFVKGSIS